MMAGEEFNSFINPIWHKAGSHIVGIAEFLQQTTRKRNVIDKTPEEIFSYSHPMGERIVMGNSSISP